METQLKLNLEDLSKTELKLQQMQLQVDLFCESMGKVRRKLFAEVSELKKLVNELKAENQELRGMLKQEPVDWSYAEGDYLFMAK
jgi:hypothetical protein